MKFTPSAGCYVYVRLGLDSSGAGEFELKAGIEYTVTISEDQFIFKTEGKSRIE